MNVGRAPRDLATVVRSRLELFEAMIGEEERDERERLRSQYAERDRRTEQRRAVLGRQNQFSRALSVSGSILMSDGDAFVSGSITLGNFGIEFVTNDLKRVIVPYGSIRGLTVDENGHAIAALNDELYVAFRVRVAEGLHISEWIDDVEQLMGIDVG